MITYQQLLEWKEAFLEGMLPEECKELIMTCLALYKENQDLKNRREVK